MADVDPLVRQWLGEGLACFKAGDVMTALLAFRKVLSRDPQQIDAWTNMASLLRELGRREEALEACHRALELLPGHAPALCTLASLQADGGDFAEAELIYRRVLEQDPANFPARFHLGWALFSQGRLEEALVADEAAVAMDPQMAASHMNRGYTLMKLGRLEEAEAAILKSLELDPQLALAHWNLAFVRLLMGRMREAWPGFHWRWQVREAKVGYRPFDQPAWRGESFAGKTLLVWAEQGFGDSIQFVRYLPMVKAQGGTVLLHTQPALVELMRTCAGVDAVFSERDQPPAFDLQVPILDLPALFQSTLEDLPADVPYLSVPRPDQGYRPTDGLQRALEGARGAKVGLAWTGNPTHKDNRTRSISSSLLAPLAAIPGVSWFSLQKIQPGSDSAPLPEALQAVDLDPHLRTFSDTAYAVDRMDLVISVDTSVLHLAGAMGCPALVMLPFSPDWRWLAKGETCPWYPTFRLYRQPQPGDWSAVVRAVVQDLLGTES